jgi:hypothetical protein
VRLDALPQSPNGKIDRAALPQPDSVQIAQDEYVAPTTPTAIARTKIFEEVLHMDPVANRAGIKISAKRLLQHRTAAQLVKLADLQQPTDGQSAAANGLPTLGQFQRNRRTGSKTALH